MNIGFFTKQADGALVGNLPTMNLHNVSLEPVTKAGNGPDYRASVEGAELGAAWKKTSKTPSLAPVTPPESLTGRSRPT